MVELLLVVGWAGVDDDVVLLLYGVILFGVKFTKMSLLTSQALLLF